MLLLLNVGTFSGAFENENLSDDDDDSHQLVVFAIEGLSSAAFSQTFMPFIFKMGTSFGVSSTSMRAVENTFSVPSWTAHFYSDTPAQSGCRGNGHCELPSEILSQKSLLDVLENDNEYAIKILSECDDDEPNPLEDTFRRQRVVEKFPLSSREMMDRLMNEQVLPQTNRRAFVIHFSSLVKAGQAHRWDGESYNAHAYIVDWQISQICKSLWEYEPERTTFVVISNHGGSGYGFHNFDLKTLNVPLAMWGYGISREGKSLTGKAHDTTQTAPTIIKAIGFEVPSNHWSHRPIGGIYGDGATSEDWDSTPKPNIFPLPLSFSMKAADRASLLFQVFALILFLSVPIIWMSS